MAANDETNYGLDLHISTTPLKRQAPSAEDDEAAESGHGHENEKKRVRASTKNQTSFRHLFSFSNVEAGASTEPKKDQPLRQEEIKEEEKKPNGLFLLNPSSTPPPSVPTTEGNLEPTKELSLIHI